MTLAARLARPRWRPGVAAWTLWALVMLGVPVAVWSNHLLRQAGRSDQAGSDVDTIIYLLAAVSAVTVGTELASRRPRHPVGWLLLALGLWFTFGYASWALLAWRGAPPAVGSAAKDVSVTRSSCWISRFGASRSSSMGLALAYNAVPRQPVTAGTTTWPTMAWLPPPVRTS